MQVSVAKSRFVVMYYYPLPIKKLTDLKLDSTICKSHRGVLPNFVCLTLLYKHTSPGQLTCVTETYPMSSKNM